MIYPCLNPRCLARWPKAAWCSRCYS